MNNQGYNFLTTKLWYNKPLRKFSYYMCAALYCLYRISFNLITTNIDIEIPISFNEESFLSWNIRLRKWIFEVNTLTIKTYNTLQNKH